MLALAAAIGELELPSVLTRMRLAANATELDCKNNHQRYGYLRIQAGDPCAMRSKSSIGTSGYILRQALR